MPLDGQLVWDDGLIKLGGELLPGVLVDMRIRGVVRFDQSEKDAQSGKQKVPMGFEDADIAITLDLLCDSAGDCYSKLKAVNEIFRKARKANPKVYAVQNQHCRARGVENVLFYGLDSYETDLDDVITVYLGFVEHMPPVVRRERQQAASKGKNAPAVKAKPAVSTTIVKDPDGPFLAGYNAGVN